MTTRVESQPGSRGRVEKSGKMHVNSSTWVEKAGRVLCRILFQKIVRVVGTRLVEVFVLDSNPPLVNTRQSSTRLSCKHSLREKNAVETERLSVHA